MDFKTLPPKAETERLLQRLLGQLIEKFRNDLISVVLFGSLGRGEWDEQSDIDILVICETLPENRWTRYRSFNEAVDKLDDILSPLHKKGYFPQFSPVLKTREGAKYHSPIYLDMVEDARFLFDRGDFFKNVLTGLRRRLKELGARRIFLSDGSWYWDLKPDYKYGQVFEI